MGLYMCGDVLKVVPKKIKKGTKDESEVAILAVVDTFDDDPFKLPETDFVWDFDPDNLEDYPKKLKMMPVQVTARINKFDGSVNKSIVLVKDGKRPDEELRKILDSFGDDDAKIFSASDSSKKETKKKRSIFSKSDEKEEDKKGGVFGDGEYSS